MNQAKVKFLWRRSKGIKKTSNRKIIISYYPNPSKMETDNSELEKTLNKSPLDLPVPNLILRNRLAEFKPIDIKYQKTCSCPSNHLNCLSAKDWLKRQLGVWEFFYEKRDIRDKNIHPATFPISLARQVIELFTHEGELVLDPFVGSGTTLVAAQDSNRNALGFDLQEKYIKLSSKRLSSQRLVGDSKQIAIQEDARNISQYLIKDSLSLVLTSPPYSNLLNRKRKNKSRRNRNNDQLGKVEQYSQDPLDLGTLEIEEYTRTMGEIFQSVLPFMKAKAHCVINVPDMWWENRRIAIHVYLVDELIKRGFELRNIIIWDRRNLVNKIGIFGWPSNYITMGVTFEYLLDFWKPDLSNGEKNESDL